MVGLRSQQDSGTGRTDMAALLPAELSRRTGRKVEVYNQASSAIHEFHSRNFHEAITAT